MLKKKFKNVNINDSINPDESVAYGATLQAEKKLGKKNEKLKEFQYIDSAPFNIGIAITNPNNLNE